MVADTNEMAMRTTRTTHGKHAHTHVKKQAKKRRYVIIKTQFLFLSYVCILFP